MTERRLLMSTYLKIAEGRLPQDRVSGVFNRLWSLNTEHPVERDLAWMTQQILAAATGKKSQFAAAGSGPAAGQSNRSHDYRSQTLWLAMIGERVSSPPLWGHAAREAYICGGLWKASYDRATG